jgi:hypothetical protein
MVPPSQYGAATMKWHFGKKRPSDKARDPVVGEFFAQDAIKNAGEALVREGIQNSLDARLDRSSRAVVRILLSGDRDALPHSQANRWLDSLWPHLCAPGSGLRPGALRSEQSCRFLVFEDFGTTGLVGDPEAFVPSKGTENAFFYFFRAEGKTQKEGDDRGRWGVGKQVFPRSSHAQAFFGYTESDRGAMLMGGCVLKNHSVDGVWYKPDGLFGELKEVEGDELTVPVTDGPTLEAFRSDFRLNRKPGERGLSVVVPYLDDDSDEVAFSRTTLAIAVLDGYFVPIIEGRLEVTIEDPSGSYSIHSSTYKEILDEIAARLDSKSGDPRGAKELKDVQRLRAHLSVAEKVAAGGFERFDLKPCPKDRPRWTEEMLDEAAAQQLRELLETGEVVGVGATLTIRPKDGSPKDGTFACYIQRMPQLTGRPCHIREDLIIANVECPRVNGFACVVRVENGPLATLLGDSEGPAHTEWQATSRNFKDKYTYGGMAISFVADFPADILRKIYAASKKLDRTLLTELFYDEGPEQPKKGEAPKMAKKGDVPGPDGQVMPEIRARVLSYKLDELQNGFVVRSDEPDAVVGASFRVRAAYETSKGTPLGAYDPEDFKFTGNGIGLVCDGCEVVEAKNNIMSIRVMAPKFVFKATGFDRNRDLYVKVDEVKGPPTQDIAGMAEVEGEE